ncbi:ribosomal-protein-alanine acetyltransferase [Idiomarina sp. A28L]|uniref:ribosomal protein S18-alanine N-acetyltransferase n=1 Tax=Idiomarina sp. A28L TaxID=1036674 RepID=UPI0002138C3B|nr:ribosomal protein S18-alanine N-acetyltransferase [Idiomarina sp. A28L]EGN74592.1 ribosomal-protein-alanine acetyltransferase [Idiomarina sp. A28L]
MTKEKQRLFIADIDRLTPDMMQIEKQSHAVPWSGQVFGLCFGGGYRVVGLYAITETGTRLIGYTVVHKVLDELSLINIAVDPEYRGNGYGRVLLENVIDYASNEQGEQEWMIFLEVRESNRAAISLYESLGFNEIGCRVEYYQPTRPGKSRENALVMALGA